MIQANVFHIFVTEIFLRMGSFFSSFLVFSNIVRCIFKMFFSITFEVHFCEYVTRVISPRRPMSRIRDMHEWCDGKLDTRTVLLLVELATELWDYPISTNNGTV